MSAKECYDYVSTISADYDYTLTIKPQGEIEETSPLTLSVISEWIIVKKG